MTRLDGAILDARVPYLHRLLAGLARLAVRSGCSKDLETHLEIIVLRHQIPVLHRQVNRPTVNNNDRTLPAAIAAALPCRLRHGWIVTTNRGLPDWGTIFGDSVVAAAVLDRLMHKVIVFNIKGPSWLLREHNSLEIATTNPNTGIAS